MSISPVRAPGATARMRAPWRGVPDARPRGPRTARDGIAGIMHDWHISPTAVVSLVSGILCWLVIPVSGAIPAIILGHRARRAVVRSGGVLRGDGMASIGLSLGYLQLAILVLLVGVSHLPPQIA